METNRAILKQLQEAGKRIFDRLNIEPGTYTAAELNQANQTGKSNKRNIFFSYPDGLGDEVIEISYGTFKAKLKVGSIWHYIWTFERLTGAKKDEKARFTKVDGVHDNVICTFNIEIKKHFSKLKNFVSNDDLRPSMRLVGVCPDLGAIVATDGHILRWEEVNISNYTGEICNYIYINPKDIADMVGLCSVSVHKDGSQYRTVVTNPDGETFITSCEHRQPRYKTVLPTLSNDGYIKLGKESIKALVSYCKTAKKSDKDAAVLIEFQAGSNVAKVRSSSNHVGDVMYLTLAESSKFNAILCFKVSHILSMYSGWNGGMWITGCDRPAVIDNSEGDGLTLVGLSYHEDIRCDELSRSIDAFNRFNQLPDCQDVEEHSNDAKRVEIEGKEPSGVVESEKVEESPLYDELNTLPTLYQPVYDCSVVFNFFRIVLWLICAFREWLYNTELRKALARVEYLAKFEPSDTCMGIEPPEAEECLKTDDYTSMDVAEEDTKVATEIAMPIYVDSVRIDPITDFIMIAAFVALVVLSVLGVPGITSGASCRLRTKVTQRIRGSPVFLY